MRSYRGVLYILTERQFVVFKHSARATSSENSTACWLRQLSLQKDPHFQSQGWHTTRFKYTVVQLGGLFCFSSIFSLSVLQLFFFPISFLCVSLTFSLLPLNFLPCSQFFFSVSVNVFLFFFNSFISLYFPYLALSLSLFLSLFVFFYVRHSSTCRTKFLFRICCTW